MTIGERVIALMNGRGLTRAEFSRQTGSPFSTINDWIRIGNNPSSDKIMKICEVLKVSPYEILQGNEPDSEERIDYMVVGEGTDKYELLIEYDKLHDDQKLRLKGYLKALTDENK